MKRISITAILLFLALATVFPQTRTGTGIGLFNRLRDRLLKSNAAPIAINLSTIGNALTDSTLYLDWTYFDANGDVEGTGLFKWYRNGVATDSTRQYYLLSSPDSGYHIRPSVIPVALTGQTHGIETFSDSVGPILTYIPRDTFYVSTTGDNGANGMTTGTPWQTLQYANDNASAGAVIALKKGDEFSDAIAIRIDRGGTEGKPTEWNGSIWGSGANAIISTAGSRGGGENVALVHISGGCEYLTFQNITVDGNNQICFGIVIGSYTGTFSPNLVQNNENNITIQDCYVTNIGDGSAYLPGIIAQTWNTDISNITIQRNTIDSVGSHAISFYPATDADGAPYIGEISDSYIGYNTISNFREYTSNVGYGIHINNKTTNTIVEHNTIGDGAGSQLALDQNEVTAGYFPTNITIRYNLLTGNIAAAWPLLFEVGQAVSCDVYGNIIRKTAGDDSGGGIWIFNHGARTSEGADMNFYFNTIYLAGGRGIIDMSDWASVVDFKNNIIYSDGVDDCVEISTSGSMTHSYNSYFMSGGDLVPTIDNNGTTWNLSQVVANWEATAIVSDPTFTVEFTNLHYQTGSPVDGAGVTISGITEDMEGTEMTEPPDIGALHSIVDP